MKFTPFEPQKLALEHLRKNPDTFLIMGMGLGKTSTILERTRELIQSGESRGTLVVAPLRVKNLTWPDEVRKYEDFSWMRVADLKTKQGIKQFRRGSAHLYLINWDSLVDVAKLLARKNSGIVPYDTVVFDESTKAKSDQSKRVALYRAFCPRVARHIAMTGTPAPNSLLDLWGQMMMVDNGRRLGPSYPDFQKRFFQQTGYMGRKWVPQENAEERIYRRIADCTLVLKTSDYLDLPDTVLHDIEVPLSSSLASDYKEFEKELILQVKDQTINAVNAAALVTKLLQFTSGAVYDDERVVANVHNLKMQALKETVEKINGPVLVMYGYQHELDRIRQVFPKAEFMHEATSKSAQVEILSRWNRGKIPMLVGHPRSMAHGLNMQEACNNIIWLTLTYSKEGYEQAIGRLHRRGQGSVVHNWRLMCPGTVDEAVAESLRNKAAVEGTLIEALKKLGSYRDHFGFVPMDDEDVAAYLEGL